MADMMYSVPTNDESTDVLRITCKEGVHSCPAEFTLLMQKDISQDTGDDIGHISTVSENEGCSPRPWVVAAAARTMLWDP